MNFWKKLCFWNSKNNEKPNLSITAIINHSECCVQISFTKYQLSIFFFEFPRLNKIWMSIWLVISLRLIIKSLKTQSKNSDKCRCKTNLAVDLGKRRKLITWLSRKVTSSQNIQCLELDCRWSIMDWSSCQSRWHTWWLYFIIWDHPELQHYSS